MVAPQADDVMRRIEGHVPLPLLQSFDLYPMAQDLRSEILHDYEYSIRKNIGVYSGICALSLSNEEAIMKMTP